MAAKVAMIQVERGGSVTEAAREVGYAEASAQSGKIQKTKTYRDIMAKHNDATVKRLLLLRQEAAKALKNKAKTAKYSELWSGIETATKTIQTLTGSQTSGDTPIPILNLSLHFTAVNRGERDTAPLQVEAEVVK